MAHTFPLARVISTIVLAPIVLGAVFAGVSSFVAVVALASAVMTWEWARIVDAGAFRLPGVAATAAVLGGVTLAALSLPEAALVVVLAGSVAVYLAARAVGAEAPGWYCPAPAVIGLAAVSLLWIRIGAPFGLRHALFLLGAVWMTDLGAYFFGRLIGGPRLAPRISPRKTWAGLIGGAVCAALWAAVSARYVGAAPVWPLVLLGALIAPVAQAGDLAVSVIKRRFGVKDASNLIPGHGGVLDRCDGLLITAPALSLLMMANHGDIFSW